MVATIRACEVNDFIFNASLRCELVERLPATLKLDWARYTRNDPNPNLASFSAWLYAVAEDASTVMVDPGRDQRHRYTKKDGFLNLHTESEASSARPPNTISNATHPLPRDVKDQCEVCRGGCSAVAKCSRFEELSYESKWATVKERKLCRKCLRRHNGTCKQQRTCGVNGCTYLHHPLLHNHDKRSSPQPKSYSTTTTKPQPERSCNIHLGQSTVLFRIIPVVLYGPERVVETYAFFDDGSELTLMEQGLAEELGINGPRKSLCLKWTGGSSRLEKDSQQVNFQISGTRSVEKYELSGVYTVPSLQIRP